MKKLYSTLAVFAATSIAIYAANPVDITPRGYNFDSYEDGVTFKIFSTETQGAWSGPANFYKDMHPTAFDDYGQLTSIMYRGMGTDLNNQANVDAKIQPMVTIRKMDDYIGNALVINEQYSPTASKFQWPGSGFNGAQPQFSFFLDNKAITEDLDKTHYIRVRLVYNVLFRGCHYTQDAAASKDLNVVKSIYATDEGNWVIPENDHETGAKYAETGMNFAKWVNETGLEADIPETPEVYIPADTDADPWDISHHGTGCINDPNGKPAYLINSERFRVYEFDAPMTSPATRSLSVQFNILDRNVSYIIKEIKFYDLGTDETAATLLGKRQLGWKYYNAQSLSGIDNIVAEDNTDSEPIYYNLQGVQITNPQNGIYIVRRGNKVSKEIIR